MPENITKCKACGSRDVIKHGKQDGRQKYKCQSCGKYFLERRIKIGYSKKERKFLSMLLNFLNNYDDISDDSKTKLENALADIDIENKDISKIQLVEQPYYADKIACYNPRLLICTDDKYITWFRIPPNQDRDEEGNIKARTIEIIDSENSLGIKYL